MSALWQEAARDRTAFLIAVALLAVLLSRALRPEERRRLLVPVYLTLAHLLLLPAVVATEGNPTVHDEVRLVALWCEALAVIGWGGALLFARLLPLVGLRAPGILRDLVLAAASFVSAFTIAHRLGFSLHGIIATSAVVTGVVGFSLQDVLGNVMAGLSLQLDRSVALGDWVRLAEVAGRVTEIRWRHTAIETRNGDTVLLPNSLVTRQPVTVLGRSANRAGRSRRWVWFNVDFRFPPTEVIAAVEGALGDGSMKRVAAEPAPDCVLMDLGESYGRYAVRYWLSELQVDDATDSLIRTRIFFALSRAAVTLSIPAHAVFVTQESPERQQRKQGEALERRRRLLAGVDLFSHFADADRDDLAARMRPARFVAGEVIHRQGAEAHWLYVLAAGEVEERVTHGDIEEAACRLRAPELFGEMSLLTGSPRQATVVAVTDVECFRLDKRDFERLLRLPGAAEHLARVLAARRVALDRARAQLDEEAQRRLLTVDEKDILDKIRAFFGLDRTS